MNEITRDSLYDVTGTATDVMYFWEEAVREELSNTAIIYDEGLSYQSALRLFRENNNYSDNFQDPIPMLAYKRTPVRPSDKVLGRRFKNKKACVRKDDGTLDIFNIVAAEFDILFAYFCKDIELQEKFEVSYEAELGISELKTLKVNIRDIGDVNFHFEWEDLQELTIQEDEANYFKSIIGSVKVRGFFFVFNRNEGKVINTIDAKFISSPNLSEEGLDELLSNCIIE